MCDQTNIDTQYHAIMAEGRIHSFLNFRTGAVVRSRCLVLLAWMATLEGGETWGWGAMAQQFDGCVWETEGGVINLKPLANTDGTPR